MYDARLAMKEVKCREKLLENPFVVIAIVVIVIFVMEFQYVSRHERIRDALMHARWTTYRECFVFVLHNTFSWVVSLKTRKVPLSFEFALLCAIIQVGQGFETGVYRDIFALTMISILPREPK